MRKAYLGGGRSAVTGNLRSTNGREGGGKVHENTYKGAQAHGGREERGTILLQTGRGGKGTVEV